MGGGIGVSGFILLIIVALLLFGPNKLPQLGRAVGRTLKEFKEGARDIIGDEEDRQSSSREVRNTEAASAPAPIQTEQAQNRRLPD